MRNAHPITLPSNLASGDYRIVAGAYLPDGRAVEGVARIELGSVSLGYD